MKSWIDVSAECDFSIHNIPFGICSVANQNAPTVCTAMGEFVFCLAHLNAAGVLGTDYATSVFASSSINALMALDPALHVKLRQQLQELFRDDCLVLKDNKQLLAKAMHRLDDVTMHMPIAVANYADFYSSIEHATNVGTMFRDASNPLLPNWKHIPIGYNGRASTVVVSGTPIARPYGQTKADADESPKFEPTKQLDFELEMGIVIGKPSRMGKPVAIDACGAHIFGYVLLNDWSARDIQKWEYIPLGPFLAKSFATSISPWVVTSLALEPFRVASAKRDVPLLPYLRESGLNNYDVHLQVDLIAAGTKVAQTICKTNYRTMYFSPVQQVAHLVSNGTNLCTGDLYGSGTISGSTSDSYGSLLEICWKGSKPLAVGDGSTRVFLKDNDTVVMKGFCQKNGVRVGFGQVRGTIVSSPS